MGIFLQIVELFRRADGIEDPGLQFIEFAGGVETLHRLGDLLAVLVLVGLHVGNVRHEIPNLFEAPDPDAAENFNGFIAAVAG